jgi:hypothetical protein
VSVLLVLRGSESRKSVNDERGEEEEEKADLPLLRSVRSLLPFLSLPLYRLFASNRLVTVISTLYSTVSHPLHLSRASPVLVAQFQIRVRTCCCPSARVTNWWISPVDKAGQDGAVRLPSGARERAVTGH